RSYACEPKRRGRRDWKDKADAKAAVYANRRRMKSPRGIRLRRKRGELLERPNAHCYETGRMRHLYLRGRENILKRLLVHVAGCNLGLLMRTVFKMGTPRGLQGRVRAFLSLFLGLVMLLWDRMKRWSDLRNLIGRIDAEILLPTRQAA